VKLLDQLERWIRNGKRADVAATVPRLKDLHARAEAKAQGKHPAAQVVVNLDQVRELAAIGLSNIATIARHMRLRPELLRGPVHRDTVHVAFEEGQADFAVKSLRKFDSILAGDEKASPQQVIANIFRAKQPVVGWTDTQKVVTSGAGQDPTGARERARELVERFRTTHRDRRATGCSHCLQHCPNEGAA
jgi:hypothetical protein